MSKVIKPQDSEASSLADDTPDVAQTVMALWPDIAREQESTGASLAGDRVESGSRGLARRHAARPGLAFDALVAKRQEWQSLTFCRRLHHCPFPFSPAGPNPTQRFRERLPKRAGAQYLHRSFAWRAAIRRVSGDRPSRRPGFLSHLRSPMATMNQKSPLTQNCFEWPVSSPGPINVEIVDYLSQRC